MSSPQHLQSKANSTEAEGTGNTAATDANSSSSRSISNAQAQHRASPPTNPLVATAGGPLSAPSNTAATASLDKELLFNYNALDDSMNDAELQALRAAEDGDEDFPSLFWDYMDDSNSNINGQGGGISLNEVNTPALPFHEPTSGANPVYPGTSSTQTPQGTIRCEVQNPLQPNGPAAAPSGILLPTPAPAIGASASASIPVSSGGAAAAVVAGTPAAAAAVNFDFSAPGFLAELAQQIANGSAAMNQGGVNLNFAGTTVATNAASGQPQPSAMSFIPHVTTAAAGGATAANGVGLVNVGGVNQYPFLLPSVVNLSNVPTPSGAPAPSAPNAATPGPAPVDTSTAGPSSTAGNGASSTSPLMPNVWNEAGPGPAMAANNPTNTSLAGTNASTSQGQPQASASNSANTIKAGNNGASSSNASIGNRSLSNAASIPLPQPNAQFFGLPPPPSTLGIQSIPSGIPLTTQQAQQLQATQQNLILQQMQQAQQQAQSVQTSQQQQQQQQIRQQFENILPLGNLTGTMLPPQQHQIQMRTAGTAPQASQTPSDQAVANSIYPSQLLPLPRTGATPQVIPQTPTSTDGAVLAHAGVVSQSNDGSSACAPSSSATNSNVSLRRPPLAPNTSGTGTRKQAGTRTIANILPATSNFVSSSDTDESHATKGGKKRKMVTKTRKGSDVSVVSSASNGLGGSLGVNVTVPMGLNVPNMQFGSLTSSLPVGGPNNGMMPSNITSMSNMSSTTKGKVPPSGPAGKKRKSNSAPVASKTNSSDGKKKDDEVTEQGAELEMTEEERQHANRLRNREHARNTRARKKAYLESLKSTLEELCQERDTDASERARAASLLLEMQKTRTDVLLHFFALRANNETRRQLWSSILEESVTTVMPVTPYRSFPASEVQVSKCQRTLMGVDGMIADAASLHVLLGSLVDRARFPDGKVKFQYTLVAEEALVSGNQMMARWSMTTTNARNLGSRREVSKMGMLCARFSSAHKIVSLEIMFDVMAFMLQLKQAANSQAFTVVPNTVQTCHGPFGDAAMVMTLAERPYTIVQVNAQWEKMTGWKAEDVVGKTSCKILHGEKTEKDALEELMSSIRFKRPSFTILTNYTRGHERSFRNFLTLYPLSTDSKITHYVGLTTHQTWIDKDSNGVKKECKSAQVKEHIEETNAPKTSQSSDAIKNEAKNETT